MKAEVGGAVERSQSGSEGVDLRFDLFAMAWAIAALFHLAGNARPPWIPTTVAFTAVQLGVAAAAVLVLVGYRRRTSLLVLCLLIPVSAWLEAPVVGNHWVLAAVLSLVYVVASIVGRRRSLEQTASTESVWRAFAPAARLSLLIAYAFAAFAKLNSGFFDPSTSCAVFYQDQLVRSWGLGGLSVAGQPALGTAVAVGAALTELGVAALLLVPRTRRAGVLLGLGFHWLLALDWSQHFWDFSAVLFAGFLLFLDADVLEDVRRRGHNLGAAIRPIFRRVLAGLGAVAAAATVAATAAPASPVLRGITVLAGHLAWVLLATPVLALVVLAVLSTPTAARPVRVRATGVALLVPVLVFANGLTPYLELKTGFGWNMYGNLRTVAGETNHLLVPRTLDLTGLQSDRVTIVASSDQALAELADTGYEIVFSEFREYAAAFPDESVTYRRGGDTVEADRIGDDPAVAGDVSPISYRLQSFRLVDVSGKERCQPVFTPAR